MYEPELNFLTQFKLSRNGMILELKDEFNLMRWAMLQYTQLPTENKNMMDKVIVTSLRKLLFENQHKSILLEMCPDFKMPALEGRVLDSDKLKVILPPFRFTEKSKWMSIEDWGKQNIAYFEKTVDDLPEAIPSDTFECVVNQLKGNDKVAFKQMHHNQKIDYKGESLDVYVRNDPQDSESNTRIFDLMNSAGYYNLSLYNFIKHLSDKRGAHIDFSIAPLIKIMNEDSDGENITVIQCLALQLIYAAKNQILELDDYWPEMNEIIASCE